MRKKHQQIEQLDGAQEFPKNPPLNIKNNAVKCETCGKTFKNKSDMNKHLLASVECFREHVGL